jgi:hypothetical protein
MGFRFKHKCSQTFTTCINFLVCVEGSSLWKGGVCRPPLDDVLCCEVCPSVGHVN